MLILCSNDLGTYTKEFIKYEKYMEYLETYIGKVVKCEK